MIIDASALLAVLLEEPEAQDFVALLAQSPASRMSAVNYLEAAIQIDQHNSVVATQAFDAFVDMSGIVIEPITISQTRIARRAYAQFGKGKHRASLNFGDVFAYALAKERGEPLLYKGNDFVHTDIEMAK